MATSLAEQLKKLATPQTSVLRAQDKKRPSLLFDAKEAATYERIIILEIAQTGLRELITRNKKFQSYGDNLFSDSSVKFERAIETKESNDHLNQLIKKFLINLSPYLQLKCAHQTLEWLVNRYLIHEYNKNDFMALILPYHETNIFIRCLQLVNIKDEADQWHWLYQIQKTNVICVKSVIINHCASDIGFLKFICQDILDKTKANESNAQLTVEYAFYCTTIMGALEYSKKVSDAQLSQLLPTVLKGLASGEPDFISSVMMIVAFLLVKTKLKEKLLVKLLHKLMQINIKTMNSKTTILILLIYQTQSVTLKTLPVQLVKSLSQKEWFVGCLKELAVNGAFVVPLVEAIFTGIVKCMQDSVDDLPAVEKLGFGILKSIILDEKSAETLIR